MSQQDHTKTNMEMVMQPEGLLCISWKQAGLKLRRFVELSDLATIDGFVQSQDSQPYESPCFLADKDRSDVNLLSYFREAKARGGSLKIQEGGKKLVTSWRDQNGLECAQIRDFGRGYETACMGIAPQNMLNALCN